MMRYVPGFTFPLPELYNSVFPEIPSSQFPVIRLYNYRNPTPIKTGSTFEYFILRLISILSNALFVSYYFNICMTGPDCSNP